MNRRDFDQAVFDQIIKPAVAQAREDMLKVAPESEWAQMGKAFTQEVMEEIERTYAKLPADATETLAAWEAQYRPHV